MALGLGTAFFGRPLLKDYLKARREQRYVEQEMQANGRRYHEWLSQYNIYYHGLPEQRKVEFLARVISFMYEKRFHYHLDRQDYIPVLVSGAAVQITFGLKEYRLRFFSDIHIVSQEYYLGHRKELFRGHVQPGHIYLAWNHFVFGYIDNTDGINLGLHEMAHALTYEIFHGKEASGVLAFRKGFNDYTRVARPHFEALREGQASVLNKYAATDFDEFWAVCIETFFENPKEFKAMMPDLYMELGELLNQDPTWEDKLIDTRRV